MSVFDSALMNLGDYDAATRGSATGGADYLHYAYADSNNDVNVAVCDLRDFAKSKSASDLGKWSNGRLRSLFPNQPAANYQSTLGPAAVFWRNYVYFFWVDSGGAVRGMRTDPKVKSAVNLTLQGTPDQSQGGNLFSSQPVAASNLVATLTPGGEAIVVQFLAQAQNGVNAIAKNASIFVTWRFPLDAYEDYADWPGTFFAMQVDSGKSLVQNYGQLGAAWFMQGASDSRTGGAQAAYYQAILCYGGGDCQSFCWQVDAQLDSKASTASAVSGLGQNQSHSIGGPATLTRDPGGALRVFYCDKSQNACTAYLDPNTNGTGAFGLDSPAWTGVGQIRDNDGDGYTSSLGLAATYVPVGIFKGNSPVPLPTPTGGTDTYANCVMQRYVAVIFSDVVEQNSPYQIQILTRFAGTAVLVPDYASSTPSDPSKLLLSMVADTFPYPIPNPQVWNSASPSGTVDWTGCTYEYLVGNEKQSEVTIDVRGAIGLKSTGSADLGGSAVLPETTLQLGANKGLAWDISISAGAEALFTDTQTQLTATAYDISTKGTPGGNSDGTLAISPDGVLFGRTYPNVSQDVCLYVDRDGNINGGPDSPLVGRLRPSGNDTAASAQFSTYCYTPGDLNSYAPLAIDTRMAALFGNLGNLQSAFSDIKGKDYRGLYTGSYTDNVVNAFGVNVFGPNGNQPYLEFSFSEEGAQKTQYQDTSSFTFAGSFFVDLSLYVGTTTYVGLLVFNASETSTVGVEVSFNYTAGGTDTSTWGLQLANFLNPLGSGEAYTVRMYFLKPSPLWAAEVEYFGGGTDKTAQLDFGNSAPVRVLFTVPYISPTLSRRLSAGSS